MKYEQAYPYAFCIARFRDGDTLEGFIRCGCCNGSQHVVVRLPAIDSWELDSSERARALEVARLLTTHYRGQVGVLAVRTLRHDCYGRVIADVLLGGQSLAQLIVDGGGAWWGVNTDEPEGHVRFVREEPATLTAG